MEIQKKIKILEHTRENYLDCYITLNEYNTSVRISFILEKILPIYFPDKKDMNNINECIAKYNDYILTLCPDIQKCLSTFINKVYSKELMETLTNTMTIILSDFKNKNGYDLLKECFNKAFFKHSIYI